MSSSSYRLPLALPLVVRDERGGAVAGVCAGIARSLDVDATVVRLGFSLLALASGAGIVAYVAAWLALPADEKPAPSQRRRLLGLVLLVVAAALALRGLGLGDALVWPAAFVGSGIYLTRRGQPQRRPGARTGGDRRPRLRRPERRRQQPGGADRAERGRGGAPARPRPLGLAGRGRARRGANGPDPLAGARRDGRPHPRLRAADARARAARVGRPRRVGALARRQERELRGWLYPDPQAAPGGLAEAIDAAAAEVEELHGVPVELVRTGDASLDDGVEALVLAAREAMANAARHSETDEISVFVDVGGDELAVFVRDRGRGFDPGAAAAPGHGIEESIRARMARAGGTAAIDSSPEGTEVELRLRRRP